MGEEMGRGGVEREGTKGREGMGEFPYFLF